MSIATVVNTYGLRRIKLVKGASVYEFPVAQTLEISPQLDSAELKGDDILWKKIAKLNSVKLSLKNGGLPMEAMAMFLGTAPVIANGGAANETQTITAVGGEVIQSCVLYGESRGADGDNVHVKFFNVTLDSFKLNMAGEAFAENATEFTAVKDSVTGKLFEFVVNKTAAALP